LKSFALSNTATDAEKQEFLRHLQVWKAFSSTLIAEARSAQVENNAALLEQSFGEGYRLFSAARTFIDVVGERRLQHVENFTVQIDEDSRTIASRLIGLVIAGALIILAVTWLLPMLVTVPLRTISNRIRNIAEGDGDLTIRLQIERRDEL